METKTDNGDKVRADIVQIELRARDEFEQAKTQKSAELVRELQARAEAKTHERYLHGVPEELVKNYVRDLEKRIAKATAYISGNKERGDAWVSADDLLAILRGEEAQA